MLERELLRQARHNRVRKKVSGDPERPRLNIYRSLNNIYAQIVDDTKGVTLVTASTLDKDVKDAGKNGGNIDAAKSVGELVAKRALDKGIKQVVFDRGGYKFHGRIKALADAARESGLDF
ncbi:MAG: 50S ribosomal protein L18 [Armatimonadota bacterium]